jgi:DNA-directed RNA polymerase specialized sigma24 family protein
MPTKAQLLARLASTVRAKQAVTESLAAATTAVHEALLAATDGGCSLAEIGERMGIDRQTVRWHLNAARKAQEKP